MLLNNFSGGLFTRLDSRLIPPNFGVKYHNIDNQTGNIEPIKDDKIISPTNKSNLINFQDKWLLSNDEYLLFKDMLIQYGKGKIPKKSKDGINFDFLGIKEPFNKLSYTVIEDIITETISQTYSTTIRNFYDNVELHYIIEAYNPTTDVYSYKNLYYTTKSMGTYYIQSINFSFTNTSLTYKIYRYINRKFLLVADSSNNYTDNGSVIGNELDKKIILNGTLQYAYTYYNINDGSESRMSYLTDEIIVNSGKIILTGFQQSDDPQVTNIRLWRIGGGLTEFTLVAELPKDVTTFTDDLTNKIIANNDILNDDNLGQAKEFIFMAEYNNMLFGIKDDKLYFSDIGNANAWSPYNFIEFSYTLIGLGSTPNGLLVFTKYKTYIVTGNSPETLSKFLVDSSQGCINYKSIQSINGMCIWASTDGICTSSGGSAQIQTIDRLGKIKLNPLSSVVYDNVYYLSCEDKMYALDTRFNEPCIRTLDGNYLGLAIYNDELYGIKNGNMVKLFNDINKTLYYKSPKLIDNLLTMVKNYKVFYVYSKGEIDFTIYIDGVKVLTKSLKDGLNEIKIPQQYRLGYYVEFEVTGTGTIYEIEFKVEGRQNGR